MKVAIAFTGNRVSGPGEALEIAIYDLTDEASLLEKYENPAGKAVSARGIVMLQSVVQRGVDKLIISGLGAHAMQYASGRIEMYNGTGMTVDTALENFKENGLEPIREATHHGNHTHSHS